MSMVQFVEVDGRRVEVRPAMVTWEARCDSCGEFIAGRVSIQITGQLYDQAEPVNQPISLDLHPGCYAEGLPLLARLLAPPIPKVLPPGTMEP